MTAPPPQAEGQGPAGSWQVRLSGFQGPLDLLLHLARTGEIDLGAVAVAEVARQYHAHLEGLRAGLLSLDAAGDDLLSAATLAHLKSRRLLPPDPAEAGPGAGEEIAGATAAPGRDPALRHVAEHLQEREAVMELVYHRPAGRVAEFSGEQGIEADLFALLRAFRAILKRARDDPAARIGRERMSLVERIHWLLDRLQREGRVGFRSLFAGIEDRLACILTFLALLEVMRLRLARAFESHHHDDILIVATGGGTPPAPDAPEGRLDA